MTNKNIQMKHWKNGEWNKLYPISHFKNIFNENNSNLNDYLNVLENDIIGNLETKIDTSISNINNEIDNLETRTNTSISNINDKIKNIIVNVSDYGLVGDGDTDNTNAFNEMLNVIPEYSKVIFPTGEYRGNFISNKSLHLDFMGSTVKPYDSNLPTIKFEGEIIKEIPVTSNVVYGNRSFVVSNSSGVKKDMIGYVVDEAKRASDNTPNINTEVIKINNVVNNEIFVYDMIRSDQNTGNVDFYLLETIKRPVVENVVVDCSNTLNNRPCIWYLYCENIISNNITIINSVGEGVRHEKSYNFNASNINIIQPRLTGSGEGYGVTALKSKIGAFNNIYGEGCRHVVDCSSSYSIIIENINEVNSRGESIMLSHNGFGGNITVENVNIVSDEYAIAWSKQGIEDLEKHKARNITIKNIRHIVPNKLPSVYFVSIYIQMDYENLLIDNVSLYFVNTGTPSNDTSSCIRIGGNSESGVNINNITCNVISIVLFYEIRTSASSRTLVTLKNVNVSECKNVLWARGVKYVGIENIMVDKCDNVLALDTYGGVGPYHVDYGVNISVTNGELISSSGHPTIGLQGEYPKRASLASDYKVQNGDKIDNSRILKSGNLIILLAPVGSDITLNATTPLDPPLWVGQEIVIGINSLGVSGSGRGDVIIPSGTTTTQNSSPIILKDGGIYTLKGFNGKWSLKS